MQKRWNILVIPNTSEAGLTVGVSARNLKFGAFFAASAFAAVIAFCAIRFYTWNRDHVGMVDHLRQEIKGRDSELATIERKFGDLLSLEDKLRTIAGLKPRETASDEAGKGGKGGPETGGESLYPPDEDIRTFSFSGKAEKSPEAFLKAIDAAHDGLSEILDAFEKEQERLSRIPSINPVYSPDAWLSSGYGYRGDPISGERRFHDGVDIVAPRKTVIIAPAAGVVTFAGWRVGLGRMVEISHGYGYRTIYGHNEKLSVKRGDQVKRGDPIALLGSSGRSTGPHLHYEIRLNGKARNPYKYVID